MTTYVVLASVLQFRFTCEPQHCQALALQTHGAAASVPVLLAPISAMPGCTWLNGTWCECTLKNKSPLVSGRCSKLEEITCNFSMAEETNFLQLPAKVLKVWFKGKDSFYPNTLQFFTE